MSEASHAFPPFRSRLLWLWAVVFVGGVAGVAVYSNRVLEAIVTDSLVTGARAQAQLLERFRSLYTSEVVGRLSGHPEIVVAHDYSDVPSGIPLPATFTLKLASSMEEAGASTKALLYSPWPFHWREETGGLRDEFQRDAWKNLPEEDPYYRVTTYEGQPALRYATADIMREACVNCHNTHPSTPRKGWVKGDIRGVLEIVYPLARFNREVLPRRRKIAVLTVSVLAYGFVLVGILLYQGRRNRIIFTKELEQRTQENRLVEQRLNASKKLSAVAEISSGMAHELSQPLGTMKLSCASMIAALEDKRPEAAKLVVDRISRQVDRIDGIVRKFNSFVRESSRSKIEETNLASVLKKALKETLDLSERVGVRVKLSVDPDLPLVLADAVEMEIVARNLITNALQATEGRPEPLVTLKVGHDAETVYFEVSDNGIGVKDEVRDKIFEPFFTTKRVDKGTGLGLSLCRGVLGRHRGTIELQSTGPEGTCFKVVIPRVSPDEPHSPLG